jgi:hypothetical protein
MSFLDYLKTDKPVHITAANVDFLLAVSTELEFPDLLQQCGRFKDQLRSLSSSYRVAAFRARDTLDQAFDCLARSAGAHPSAGDLEEAQSEAASAGTAIAEADEIDRQIGELCGSKGPQRRTTDAPTIATLHEHRSALEKAMQEVAWRIA